MMRPDGEKSTSDGDRAHSSLAAGLAYYQRGELALAEQTWHQCLRNDTDPAEAHRLLAMLNQRRGDFEASLDHGRQCLALNPNSAAAHATVAAIFDRMGDLNTARRHCARALELDPEMESTIINLAMIDLRLGDAIGAMDSAARIAHSSPLAAHAMRIRALSLEMQGKLQSASEAMKEYLQANPTDAEMLHRHGGVLEQLADWQGALERQLAALRLRPGYGAALSDALMLKRRLADWDGLDDLQLALDNAIAAKVPGVKPFSCLSESTTPAQQLSVAQTWAEQFRSAEYRDNRALRPPSAQDPIRLGLVSNGFGNHPTGLLIVEAMEHLAKHDHIDIHGYSLIDSDHSTIRQRLDEAMQMRTIKGRSHQDIARLIRDDEIDILVDLRGYGGGAVTEVFAQRPAPIQVNWLAYPGTLGSPWMDYVLVDPQVATPEILRNFSERPIALPHCFQPNDTTREVAESTEVDRAQFGLPSEAFVFVCFNNSYKITPAVFSAWMQILKSVPQSILWLLDGDSDGQFARNLRRKAERAGVAPARLHFAPKRPHLEYLAQYTQADLFLDTLPYNAHTTASDSLWAGCPVLTLAGDTFAGRVACSLLTAAGLPELITHSSADYIDLAIELANNQERLQGLRERLARTRRRREGLFDQQQMANDLAEAFITMHRTRRDA